MTLLDELEINEALLSRLFALEEAEKARLNDIVKLEAALVPLRRDNRKMRKALQRIAVLARQNYVDADKIYEIAAYWDLAHDPEETP